MVQSYIRKENYNDRKSKASPLQGIYYCYILQPITDHQVSEKPPREFKWITPSVVEKAVTFEIYIVRETNTDRIHILLQSTFRNFNTNTPLEDSYTKKNFRPDDDIIVPQDVFYSIAREAESNPSFLDHLKVYRDAVMTEHTHSWDSITQQSVDGSFSRKHNFGSNPFADALHSNTHSSKGYVNAPKNDTRITNDAPIQIDDMSNIPQDSSFWHDTDSIVSTEVKFSTDQTAKPIQEEAFSSGGKNNLRSNPNPNFSDSSRF